MWTEDLPEGQHYAEGFGTEADYQAWMDYQERVRQAGAYVDSGELVTARSGAVVQPTLAVAGAADAPRATSAAGSLSVRGFYLVDVPDEDAALALAREMPLYGSVEVRALVSYDGDRDASAPATDA